MRSCAQRCVWSGGSRHVGPPHRATPSDDPILHARDDPGAEGQRYALDRCALDRCALDRRAVHRRAETRSNASGRAGARRARQKHTRGDRDRHDQARRAGCQSADCRAAEGAALDAVRSVRRRDRRAADAPSDPRDPCARRARGKWSTLAFSSAAEGRFWRGIFRTGSAVGFWSETLIVLFLAQSLTTAL